MQQWTILKENDFIDCVVWAESQPANGVPELQTELFVKARFNHTTREFYEGATQQELEIYFADKIEEIKTTCRRALMPTDWYVIRKLERDIDIPPEITGARQQILDACNAQIESITGNGETLR